jgi:Ala-tRNA(Pro) deacylase
MSLADRVKWFLDVHRVDYEVVMHDYTESSLETARAAAIPCEKLAKAILLEDENGYVMPIVPASRRLDLDKVRLMLGRPLQIASGRDAAALFFDCSEGAVPPMGTAYGIPTVIDDELLGLGDIYFEGGDHMDLVHMGGAEFFALIPDSNHADLSMAM